MPPSEGVTADTHQDRRATWRPTPTRSSTTSPTPSGRRHQRRPEDTLDKHVDAATDLLRDLRPQRRGRVLRERRASRPTPTTARADAVKIAEDIKPFHGVGRSRPHRGLRRGAGRAGHPVHRRAPAGNQEEFAERAPYGIGLGLTNEQARAHNVEALAKQVAGRNAEYAGDPELPGPGADVRLPPHRDRRSRVGRGRAETRSTPRRRPGVEIAESIPLRPRPGHAPGDGGQRHRPA